MAFCMNCGKQLPNGAKFCSDCGAAIGQVSNQSDRQLEHEETVNLSYETICSSCGETIYIDQYDLNDGAVICPDCGETNQIFSMDCPTCGEHFIYNGSEVFCGIVDCHSCGSECQTDFEVLRSLLGTIDLDDDEEYTDDEECTDDEEYTDSVVHSEDEEVDEDEVVSGLRYSLLPDNLLQSFADENIELAMDGYADEDRSMDLFTILVMGKIKSSLPKDKCYKYLLKSLYDYYTKRKDEKIEICYTKAVDKLVYYLSSKESVDALKVYVDSLTIELCIGIFFEIIQTELDFQKSGLSPFKTLDLAESIKTFQKNIKRDPVLGAKRAIVTSVEEQSKLIFETYKDIVDVAGNEHGKTERSSARNNQPTSQSQGANDDALEQATDPIEELNALIGLSSAKKSISELRNFAKVQKLRQIKGLPVSDISYHLVFTGNPGTGKTTVARLIAKIYKELGLVSKGHLIEASAKDLIAGYVGQTAIKTGEVLNEALGGVLFIDEAYTLVDEDGKGFGQEAIDTILKEMEDHRDDLAIIVAGYSKPMEKFIRSNPGLKSRFNRFVHFEDYTPEELFEIFQSLCKKNAYTTNKEADEIIKEYLAVLTKSAGDDFANARTVRNLFESIIAKQATRISSEMDLSEEMLSTITEADVEWCLESTSPAESLESVLTELNSLTGLEMVKDEIADLVHVVEHQRRRKAQGLRVPSMSLHLVFMGNPGTGKTTVARYIARLYKCLGLLSKGQLIETDRSGLVAGYIGQTAIKTQEVINEAMGGVLFIDEAYTLNGNSDNDFGQEAIDTLLKAMEDKRDDFVVVVAGYPDLMDSFVQSNPGLESRFNRYMHFEDYSAEEMLCIFKMSCQKNQYTLTESAATAVENYFSNVSIPGIANGRGARNLFEKVVTQQAKRTVIMSDKTDDLSTITEDDIINALEQMDI